MGMLGNSSIKMASIPGEGLVNPRRRPCRILNVISVKTEAERLIRDELNRFCTHGQLP